MDNYTPSSKILQRYADVLVNFALNSGQGIKQGEIVQCVVPDIAKPLLKYLQIAVLKAGGQPLLRLVPTGLERDYYTYAKQQQLEFFPKDYLFARAELIDHQIGIIADTDPNELKGIDPAKIMTSLNKQKPYRDKLFEKENQGEFTWTLGLWGTPAKASVVGLSLKEYWQQIIKACFLDKQDPIAQWRQVTKLQGQIISKLNKLKMEWVHMQGEDLDIKYKLGETRVWVGGSGRNIPSFEIFTSPDWRGTEGWIRFNQPLYRYGQVISGIELAFKQGVIVKAKAKRGNKLLQEMIKTPNANKIGEISLTDKRMSRINHVMAETLFDENIGGEYGNTHLAIGTSYHECYRGDIKAQTKQDWERMGFNDSAEHTDIISTTNRVVTATLATGREIVIYKHGKFVL